MGRKILAVCCLVAFCLATFVGCNPTPSSKGTPGKGAPASTTGKTAKPVKKG
jgi:hypothetical protein